MGRDGTAADRLGTMTAAASALTSLESARLAVAALAEGGIRHVIVCPGSRSAPLAYALAEAESGGTVTLHVRIDERDAGFTALGLALATGRPAAIVTTSGTAVGELLPAVMEANHAGVPLVVLSADRPEELRGTGANQTTDQTALFGTHVRHCTDLPAGTDPSPELRRALLAAEGIVAADGHPGPGIGAPGTSGMGGMGGVSVQVGPCGPVHVNLAFRDPLVPDPGDRLPSTGADNPESADNPGPRGARRLPAAGPGGPARAAHGGRRRARGRTGRGDVRARAPASAAGRTELQRAVRTPRRGPVPPADQPLRGPDRACGGLRAPHAQPPRGPAAGP